MSARNHELLREIFTADEILNLFSNCGFNLQIERIERFSGESILCLGDENDDGLLEALPNWSWSPHADFWRTGYSYLVKYVEREGTSLVPQIHKENEFQLGTWVNGQRTAYRKGSLEDKHITSLEKLPGWTWKPARGPHKF